MSLNTCNRNSNFYIVPIFQKILVCGEGCKKLANIEKVNLRLLSNFSKRGFVINLSITEIEKFQNAHNLHIRIITAYLINKIKPHSKISTKYLFGLKAIVSCR